MLNIWIPRIPIKCTCFTDKPQCIDIAGYLGIVDWSKVPVDTPILVRDYEESDWEKRHFAFFEDGKIYAWLSGTTSWTSGRNDAAFGWTYAKLAEV